MRRIDTYADASPSICTACSEIAQAFESVLADGGVGEEKVGTCGEHAFGFSDFSDGQTVRAGSELSGSDFNGFVSFRVWTKVQSVIVAIGLHPFQIALEDLSVDHEGGGRMVFGDFVEKHGVQFGQKMGAVEWLPGRIS